MRILNFLAVVVAVSEGVLGYNYLQGEGQLAPSNAYLFRVRDSTKFDNNLTIFDACSRVHQACDRFVKPIQVRKADGLVYYAHHVLDCRPDLSALPVFYAACGYRISPTPGVPSTYNSQDIPIDVTWEALNGLKYYRIYPRGDEMLRGIRLDDQAANSTGHHSDHSHQARAESQSDPRSRIHHHRSLKAQS